MIFERAEIPLDLVVDVSKSLQVAGSGDWIVEGMVSTSDVDLVNDVISDEALKQAENDLRERSTVLHNHHTDESIGRILDVKFTGKGLWVKVLISKTVPDIWKKVQEGVLNKFSIRAKIVDAVKRWDEKLSRAVNYVKQLKIVEASLVSVPVNAKAEAMKFYVQKALEEFEMSGRNAIIPDSSLDKVLDEMERQGLLGKKGVDDPEKVAAEAAKKEAEEKAAAEAKAAEAIAAEAAKKEAEAKAIAEAKAAEEASKALAEKAAKASKQDEGADGGAGEGEDDETLEPCPLFRKEGCPVKDFPKSGEVPPEAEKCPKTKEYACPYLKAAKSQKDSSKGSRQSIKDAIADALIAAMDSQVVKEKMVSIVKEEIESLKALGSDVTKNVSGLNALQSQVNVDSVSLHGEVKVLQEKIADMEKAVTGRKSQTNARPDGKGINFWKGCLPV